MMKTIFNPDNIDAFQNRIESITNQHKASWGKMNSYQMLKHCTLNEELILGKKAFKRLFIGKLFGRMVLNKMVKDEQPLKKNQPTHPDLKTSGKGNVDEEKNRWKLLLGEYKTLPASHFENFIHPFFGKMTHEEIGIASYKHIDHHLRQFNV